MSRATDSVRLGRILAVLRGNRNGRPLTSGRIAQLYREGARIGSASLSAGFVTFARGIADVYERERDAGRQLAEAGREINALLSRHVPAH